MLIRLSNLRSKCNEIFDTKDKQREKKETQNRLIMIKMKLAKRALQHMKQMILSHKINNGDGKKLKNHLVSKHEIKDIINLKYVSSPTYNWSLFLKYDSLKIYTIGKVYLLPLLLIILNILY